MIYQITQLPMIMSDCFKPF